MKRFIILLGSDYYPEKWDDYKGRFDTIEEARAEVKRLGDLDKESNNPQYYHGDGWWQIIDLLTCEVAEEGDIYDE